MTLIASRPLYFGWTLALLAITLLVTLLASLAWSAALCSGHPVELILAGLLTLLPVLTAWLGHRFWWDLDHTVVLEKDTLKAVSWHRTRTFSLSIPVHVRQKSLGQLLVIVLESEGRCIARFLPPKDRYRDIRQHGANLYWQEILTHHHRFDAGMHA